MRLIDPETFVDEPYVAGLNQGGHMIAGAALVALASLLPFAVDPYKLAALIFISFELWQYVRRAAVLWDTLADLLFWAAGALAWARAMDVDQITGMAVLYPVWLTLIMGLVMLLLHLFKPRSKED